MSVRLILVAQALVVFGCNGPSSRDDHVTSDGGASDCGVDATTTAMSGERLWRRRHHHGDEIGRAHV